MKAVKVNITIEETVWREFSDMIPPRKKSRAINELIKREISRISREREEQELALAFRNAAGDKDRLGITKDWEVTDIEGWE
jgi:hypothetical protein